MILSRVFLSNYKQYAGEHDIELPSAATIGVIGANGVGKTTLFEAIEWCLYNPSSIPNKDIRPRGRSGFTRVALTLEVPSAGEQYVVERELKRSSAQACIYRIEPDGEETIIVQGAKQVTEHVSKKLIGLSHSAFTATFFTRQKELSFFGNLGNTERRREVGKLLGLETIRAAQQDIAEDRKRALSESQVLKQQYETQSQGHDFPAEIAAAENTIESSHKELGAAQEAVEQAVRKLAEAEATLEAQQKLKDAHTTVSQRILELRGVLSTANQRKQSISENLTSLEEREKQRASLQPTADTVNTLQQRHDALDQLRTRAQRKRELEHSVRSIEQRRGDTIHALYATVTANTPPRPISGWAWSDTDANDPATGCDRLILSISKIDMCREERTERALSDLRNIKKEYAAESLKLAQYQRARAQLDEQAAALSRDGDPADRLNEIDARHQELIGRQSDIIAHLTQVKAQHSQTSKLAASLEGRQFEGKCPTCAREFSEQEAGVVLEALCTQLRELDGQCRSLNREANEAKQQVVVIQRERAAIQKSAEELATLRGRIENSTPMIKDLADKVDDLCQRLQESLNTLDRSEPPSDEEIARARNDLQAWRRIIDARAGIERARGTIHTLSAEVAPLTAELTTIGEVTYDEAEHRRVGKDLQQALQAKSTIEHIDRELARRPQLESDLASCTAVIAQTSGAIETAERERTNIGFNEEKLGPAATEVRAVRESERQAIELRHRVRSALRDAENARDSLVTEQSRIATLATDAEKCQHEHDQLDQMYREFTEFERFAARWYAPKLSDITSELVSDVTNGKYDRLEFDDNFGINIYDGVDEKFPLDTFSGGERDAISLCARIALSRVIGGQGTQPPGFLVLDEVFGSLDRDRRGRLLEMLGAITSPGEHFSQVFIISHVDDVRTAPIFDELWQVVETSDGSSEIKSLAPGADIGEL